MRQFNDLTATEQQEVRSRFVIPENTATISVDGSLRAFQDISGALVGCTVRNDNFHVHGNRQNGR